MQTKKLSLFILIIILILIAVLGTGYFILNKNIKPAPTTVQTTVLNGGNSLTYKTIDTSINLDPNKVKNFIKAFGLDIPKSLDIIINYQTNTIPQGAMTLRVNNNTNIFITIDGDRYTDKIVVTILLNQQNWANVDQKSQRGFLQIALAQALIAISDGDANNLSNKKNLDYVKGIFDQRDEDFWFSIEKKNIFSFFSNFKLVKEAYAQYCGGAVTCSTTETGYMCPDGTGCDAFTGAPCIGQCQVRSTCSPSFQKVCTAYSGYPSCITPGCGLGTCAHAGQCYPVNPSTPPPTTPGTPAPGGCTSGDAFYGLNNCGEVGRVNGSGSCGSGCLCCATQGTITPPNCSLGVHLYSSTGPLLKGGRTYPIPLLGPVNMPAGVSTNGAVRSIQYVISDGTKDKMAPYNSKAPYAPGTYRYVFFCQNRTDPGCSLQTKWIDPEYMTGQTTDTPYAQVTVSAICISEGGSTSVSTFFYLSPYAVGPWWQTKGGDVISGGDIVSHIPVTCTANRGCNPYLILDAIAQNQGYPGIASYGSSSTYNNGPTADTSTNNWLTQTDSTGKVYDFTYFQNLIPSDVSSNSNFQISANSVPGTYFDSGGADHDGYSWYEKTGDVGINSAVNLPLGRKVILLVKGNLTIQAPINLTNGQGFFLIIVSGTISIDPSVTGTAAAPAIEALMLADNLISTGTGNQPLYVRGALLTNGQIVFSRDLTNTVNQLTPAEAVEFAPDMLLQFPKALSKSRITWQEVAP